MTSVYERYKQFWTPEFWKAYCEQEDPVRQYRHSRESLLALELLEPKSGARVLEAGCGYGRISSALLKSAAITLVGIDLNYAMVEFCGGNLDGDFAGATALVEVLPFADESFDAVLCSGVLMHVADQPRALSEFVRVLRPGGRLVISGNNRLSPFALPVIIYTSLRHNYLQSFKLPWFYTKKLTNLGCTVYRVVSDTLLAVRMTMTLPYLSISFPPAILLPLYGLIDRLTHTWPFNYLGYEVWIAADKR